MADFLEERLSELVRYGATWTEKFSVDTVTVAGGNEYRSLIHPYPKREFDASYMLDREDLWTEVVNVYMRAHGTYAGFRVRCFDEWSTNGPRGVPTHLDQTLIRVGAGIYQLCKRYGLDKAAGTTGYPTRLIKKPVAGTAKIGVDGVLTTSGVTVATTTGLVTIAPDPGAVAVVSGGCEFDFPVRFATELPVGMDYPGWRPVDSLKLIELLNP